MNKRYNLLTLGMAFVIVMFASSSYAEEYACSGFLGAATVDNLRVPSSATCTLDKTYVKGTIKVESKATLRAYGVDVIGNVQAENAAQVEVLSGSTVGGSIQIKQGGGAYIDSVAINSDLQFDDNRKNLIASKNIIGGNLQAVKNTGGLSITDNTIDGNLQCKENQPAPTGGGNIVKGSKEDQCANLSSGKTPPHTEDELFGAWNAHSKAKLKVRRIGSQSIANESVMQLNGDGTFALTETEPPASYIYTGHWHLINGKKLFFDLDAAGQSEFVRMWTNRVEEIATQKGIAITSINFSEISFKISQPRIPKKSSIPRRTTLRAKGWITASVNGQNVMRRFSYISRISFLSKQ